jgi:hypothetical protein
MDPHRAARRAKYPTWPENRFVPIKLIPINHEPIWSRVWTKNEARRGRG